MATVIGNAVKSAPSAGAGFIEEAESLIVRLAEQQAKQVLDEYMLGALGKMMLPTVGLFACLLVVSAVLGALQANEAERIVSGVLIFGVLCYTTVTSFSVYAGACIVGAEMFKAGIGPLQFMKASLFILAVEAYETYRAEHPSKFWVGERVLEFAGYRSTPDGIALSMMRRLMPGILRHLLLRSAQVFAPIFCAYAYLRFLVLPTLTHLDGHFVLFQAALYPFAALWRLLGGH